MKGLNELATSALLGTECRPPNRGERNDAIGECLEALEMQESVSVEKRLLQAAGVLATCELAGRMPQKVEAAVDGAEAETELKQGIPERVAQVILDILSEGSERMKAQALARLKTVGYGVPYRGLMKALDAGRHQGKLREFVLPVLGRRGAWLASQNEAWKYAIGGGAGNSLDATLWDEGSLDQRRLYLAELRKQDTARARDLIQEAMRTEGAKERVAFLACLEMGLSLEDESILELALRDKSKEVRQIALRLLSMLPGSALGRRMVERLRPCLAVEKKFLRASVVSLEAPKVFEEAWKSDLIEEKSSSFLFGDRAWWLYQMTKHAPLEWWTEVTGMAPLALLAWAADSDWKDALRRGWFEAQKVQKNVAWAEAFLEVKRETNVEEEVFQCLETLPAALREKHFLKFWTAELERKDLGAKSTLLLSRFLKSTPWAEAGVSVEGSLQMLHIMKERVRFGGAFQDWYLREVLVELAEQVPPQAFEACKEGWEWTPEPVKERPVGLVEQVPSQACDASLQRWETKNGPSHPYSDVMARVEVIIQQRQALQGLGR